MERSRCLVTEIEDRKHVEEAIRACGYPKWTFNIVRRRTESKRDQKTRQQRDSLQRPMVVIPYVENVSEAVARIMRKDNVPVAMKPHKTLKNVLVHPKDKQEKKDLIECVYKVPCSNCDETYIGKTEGSLDSRTEVESKTGCTFTRSLRASSLTEHNKSTLTDHTTQENYVINWSQVTVIDREPERFTRWIKEATHIRKEGQQAMNRDEGSYQPSHAHDCFLDTFPVVSRTGRTEYQLLLTKASDRGRNVKF